MSYPVYIACSGSSQTVRYGTAIADVLIASTLIVCGALALSGVGGHLTHLDKKISLLLIGMGGSMVLIDTIIAICSRSIQPKKTINEILCSPVKELNPATKIHIAYCLNFNAKDFSHSHWLGEKACKETGVRWTLNPSEIQEFTQTLVTSLSKQDIDNLPLEEYLILTWKIKKETIKESDFTEKRLQHALEDARHMGALWRYLETIPFSQIHEDVCKRLFADLQSRETAIDWTNLSLEFLFVGALDYHHSHQVVYQLLSFILMRRQGNPLIRFLDENKMRSFFDHAKTLNDRTATALIAAQFKLNFPYSPALV